MRTFIAFSALFCFINLAQAQNCDIDCETTIFDKMYIEVKPGYSYLSAPHRSQSGYSIRGELGIPLVDTLDLWLDGGYSHFNKHHFSSYTVGVKRQFEINCDMNLYFGLGARYFNSKHCNKEFGLAATIGSRYYVWGREPGIFLDLFLDYGWGCYNRLNILTPGLGLGTHF